MVNVERVRTKLVKIYEEHNPEKVREVDVLLEKYAGKEEQLLESVKKKYLHHKPEMTEKWSFVLAGIGKNCSDSNQVKHRKWWLEKRLEPIRPRLDKLAEAIGGECAFLPAKPSHKIPSFLVRQKRNASVYSMEDVEAKVHLMRTIVNECFESRTTKEMNGSTSSEATKSKADPADNRNFQKDKAFAKDRLATSVGRRVPKNTPSNKHKTGGKKSG